MENQQRKREYYRQWRAKNRAWLREYNRWYVPIYRKRNAKRLRLYRRRWERINRVRRYAQAHRVPLICEYCHVSYKGFRKSQRFCSRACMGKSYQRPWVNRPMRVRLPGNPNAMVHRIVMEQHLRRKLRPEEVVHHINHQKRDNRIENLLLLPNNSAHITLHWKERRATHHSCHRHTRTISD